MNEKPPLSARFSLMVHASADGLWNFSDRVFKTISWLALVALLNALSEKTGISEILVAAELCTILIAVTLMVRVLSFAINAGDDMIGVAREGAFIRIMLVPIVGVLMVMFVYGLVSELNEFMRILLDALVVTARQ